MNDQLVRHVERYEDMSPLGKLSIVIQEDGDVIVGIIPSDLETFETRGFIQTAEFCALGYGGGQSPHTLAALRQLAEAIERDNAEHPQHRRGATDEETEGQP